MAWDVDVLVDALVDQISLITSASIDDAVRIINDLKNEYVQCFGSLSGGDGLHDQIISTKDGVFQRIWQRVSQHPDIKVLNEVDRRLHYSLWRENVMVAAEKKQKLHAILGEDSHEHTLSAEEKRILFSIASHRKYGVSQITLAKQVSLGYGEAVRSLSNLLEMGFIVRRFETGGPEGSARLYLKRYKDNDLEIKAAIPPINRSKDIEWSDEDAQDQEILVFDRTQDDGNTSSNGGIVNNTNEKGLIRPRYFSSQSSSISKSDGLFLVQMRKVALRMTAKEMDLTRYTEARTKPDDVPHGSILVEPMVAQVGEVQPPTSSDILDSTEPRKRRRLPTRKLREQHTNDAITMDEGKGSTFTYSTPASQKSDLEQLHRSSHTNPEKVNLYGWLEHDNAGALDRSEEPNQSDSAFQNRFQTILDRLLNIQLPGLYINPPSRLTQTGRGRPRRKLLLVFKLPMLLQCEWFRSDDDALQISGGEREEVAFAFSSEGPSEMTNMINVDADGHYDVDERVISRQLHTLPRLGSDEAQGDSSSVRSARTPAIRSSSALSSRSSLPSATNQSRTSANLGHNSCQHESSQNHAKDSLPKDQPPNNSPVNRSGSVQRLLRCSEKPKRPGFSVTGESRTKLLLAIIESAGGAFPGDSEIWYPFVTQAHKIAPNVTPYRSGIENAVNSLIRNGKLKKAVFAFRDSAGGLVQKSILCLPYIDFESDAVTRCETGIKKAHPFLYFPEGVEIRPDLDPQIKPQSFTTHALSNGVSTYHGNMHHKPPVGYRLNEENGENRKRKEFSPVAPPTKLLWILDDLSTAAAENESMRENEARENELSATDNGKDLSRFSSLKCNAWMINMTRLVYGHQRPIPGFGTCTTLTDPGQTWYTNTGTMSTDFVVYRSTRPKLTLDTNLQRLFEDSLPADINEIVSSQTSKGSVSRPTFAKTLQAVEAWERENASSLTSQHCLVTPRFINITADTVSGTKSLNPEPRDTRSVADRGIRAPSIGHLPYNGGSGTVVNPNDQRHENNASKTCMQDRDSTRITHHPNPNPNSTPGTYRNSLGSSALVVTSETRTSRNSPAKASGSMDDNSSEVARSANELETEHVTQRLVLAMAMSKSILSGLKRYTRWGMLVTLFPGFSLEALKAKWRRLYRRYNKAIDWYYNAFDEAFLEAYANGEVPPINYNNIQQYDWEAIIEWALYQWPIPSEQEDVGTMPTVRFPGSRSELQQQFSIESPLMVVESANRRELFDANTRGGLTSRLRTMVDLTSSIPLNLEIDTIDKQVSMDDLEAATTYVRANVFTPDASYDMLRAQDKLSSLDSNTLQNAIDGLLSRKLISHIESETADAAQRAYIPNDRFLTSLQQIMTADQLRIAASYKLELDEKFNRENLEKDDLHPVLVPGSPTHAESLVLSSLASQRHISIRPYIDEACRNRISSSVSSSEESSISMRIISDESYKQGLPITMTTPPPCPHLQSPSKDKRIPLWYSIHDELLLDLWETTLVAILVQIALRPSESEENIARSWGQSLDTWDVRLVLDWLIENQIIDETLGADGRRLSTRYGWWSVLGPRLTGK